MGHTTGSLCSVCEEHPCGCGSVGAPSGTLAKKRPSYEPYQAAWGTCHCTLRDETCYGPVEILESYSDDEGQEIFVYGCTQHSGQKPVLPPDATLEVPVQAIAVQIDGDIRIGDGTLELCYMPYHEACAIAIKINDQTHASVMLDRAVFALLAAYTADPQRKIEPGTVFKG